MKKVRKSTKEQKEENKRMNDQYFEGVLQLRGLSEEQLDTLVEHIKSKDCRISKHKIQKSGVDLYLTSQKLIRDLEKWTNKRFNCYSKLTNTLHTKDKNTGKDLYRLTLLVVFLKYKPGDIMDYDGEEVKITSLGKKPCGRAVKSGKRMFLDPEKLK
jgi:nonsense-mediated mRNA decay protein 3